MGKKWRRGADGGGGGGNEWYVFICALIFPIWIVWKSVRETRESSIFFIHWRLLWIALLPERWKCMFKHIVFEFTHEERKSMEIEFLVLPAAFFYRTSHPLLFILGYIYIYKFFCCATSFGACFWLSATKRWVSEVIHIMMCTVVCSGWKAHSLCMRTHENEKVLCVHAYILCGCVCMEPRVLYVCVNSVCNTYLHIGRTIERLTIKWGLATMLNFMLYAFACM